jgi:hypothetical protein
MNKNLKYIFLFVTIIFLLASVTAISAENTTGKDVTEKSTAVTAQKAVDTQKVADTNKNIVKTENVNKTTKAGQKNHIVNQDNVDEIFSGTGNTISDSVNEGDTLDFQGTIDKNHSLVINKPIKVISSTEDAVIRLHTVAGSLMGEDPGNSFVVNNGGSNSYISGLYLDNTECWIHNVENTTFYNMSMVVFNAKVGSGVGQTSLRYSNNVTLDNCYISTTQNGGSSSFVWTGSSNCILKNSHVEAGPGAGNLVYIGNPYNTQDMPEGFVLLCENNTVENCTISTEHATGTCVPIQVMTVKNIAILNNTITANGGISCGSNGRMIGNKLYSTTTMTIGANSTAYGNEVFGTGATTINAGALVYENTFQDVTLSGITAAFNNNNVKGVLKVNNPNNVNNNNLSEINIATNGKNSNITDNNIAGNITSAGANVTISENEIRANTEYAITVTGAGNIITHNTIYSASKTGDAAVKATATSTVSDNLPEMPGEIILTDETYSNFFDEDGFVDTEKVQSFSTLRLIGTFNDKVFKFKNITATLVGEECVVKNGYILSNETAKLLVEGITFENGVNVENTVIFNTDYNTIRNSKITKSMSTKGNAREILVAGNGNRVEYVDIKISGESHATDYTVFPSFSPIIGILVTGSSNYVLYNNVTFNEWGGDDTSSTDLITVSGVYGEASYNNISRNNLKAGGADGYVYGINLGVNANNNDITYNNINVTSTYYAYGIQNLEAPAFGNNITYNTMNVNGMTTAYGVFANVWSMQENPKFGYYNIKYNKINVNSLDAFGIQLTGSPYGITMKKMNITYNNFVVNGKYAMGVGLSDFDDVYIFRNTYNITGQTNTTDTTSWDYVKPTTAGIYAQNGYYLRIATEQGNNVTNGPNVILKDMDTGSISSGLAYKSDNLNIILENTERFNITSTIINSTNEYGISLINSNNNRIQSNTLNTNSEFGGNERILLDEDSIVNSISSNKPVSGIVEFTTETATYKKDLQVEVSVKTSDNKVVTKGEVVFSTIEGTELGTVTIKDGVATFDYGLVSELDDIVIVAQYMGNTTVLKSPKVAQEISVIAESEVEPINPNVTLGDSTTLVAAFYDDNTPVNEGKAIFRINGKTLRDNDGNVIYVPVVEGKAQLPDVNITGEWMKPDTTIQAIFIGTENIDPIVANPVVVNIEKPTADIELTIPENAIAGTEIVLTAKITNGNEIVTSGRVVFKLNGKTLKGEDGKALYVDVLNGYATTTYTIPAKTKANDYVLSAVFTDTNYERSDANKTITIIK